MRRILPDTVAGRLALVLTLALLAANLVALGLIAYERDRLGREAVLTRGLDRIVDAVPVLEALDERGRRRLLRRAGRRYGGFSIDADATVPVGAVSDRQANAVAQRVREALADGREVRAAFLRVPVGGQWERGEGTGRGNGSRSPRPRLVLSIALSLTNGALDGTQWLNAVLRAPPPVRGSVGTPLLLALVLSLIAVLDVALLYVRRLVRPLRDLATAARAAGRGDRAARVEERGARELREAAAAFNDMQARIARFDAERSRQIAAVGHDLRTPITSLRIRAEMLADGDREPMVRTLDEMRVMADGLLEAGKASAETEATERINLEPFLEWLCAERGATLDVDAPLAVHARPVALGRAVGNLVDNAVRYAGTAHVRLAREGANALIAVEDDGPGIDPERLDAVLEPFVRGDASRSTQTGGAGLGLSIARSVFIAHGGSLRLVNRPPGGLRAEARVPLAAK